jgi:hypothetical protein
MGFLDRLLGREKKEEMPAEPMPAEPQMRGEGTQPETEGMAEPPPMASEPEPGSEGTGTERRDPM